ncbi:hypothetical protein CsatB_004128 [Cannabis sativa]|uniref:CRIB domain-containing protein n=1 Tax=Cannabis sativa TaxID=3483 RepID=A0A803RAF6_CANSA|nr:rho GTPase-activating protein 1 [Cannabis sativa]
MEIGLPTNVRHVAHVTFDRFNGFLGLPVEFQPLVPSRAPSARWNYFIELGALFEDVIALLSKFPGAVLSHGARSKILAAHGWQSMLCG